MVHDCMDSSDEMTCTCADYLRNSNQSALICDDHVDCSDQSDENGCSMIDQFFKIFRYCLKYDFDLTGTCAQNEQYSYLSSQCIPRRNLCDKEVQNFVGVDELNCGNILNIYFKGMIHLCLNFSDSDSKIWRPGSPGTK